MNEEPSKKRYFEKLLDNRITQEQFKVLFKCFLFLKNYISDNMINLIWEI